MTIQEALDVCFGKPYIVSCDVHEEAQQVIRDACGKQIPKKPYYEGDGYADGQLVYDTWVCPHCEEHYEVECDRYDYCPNCGQRLDRSEEE